MILVTGGAGFIGSNLIAGLEARGHRGIVVCDRLGASEKWRNLAKRSIGTIISPDRLTVFLQESGAAIDTIFHVGLDASLADVDGLLAANYHAAAELWAWCAHNEVRFFYISTAETYGTGEAGFADDLGEAALARLRPATARAWSKHLFDSAVARTVAAGSACPPQWAGFKPFDVYGPNEYHKGTGASLPYRLHAGLPDDGETWRGDVSVDRDWVWVEDCVSVVLWAHETDSVNGMFNIGTGQPSSIADLASVVERVSGRVVPIEPGATTSQHLHGYGYANRAEIGGLRAAGYAAPFLSIEDGFARYYEAYLGRDDRYT